MSDSGCASFKNRIPTLNVPPPGSESEDLEIDMGKQIHDRIIASQYIYAKSDVLAYLVEIGQKLAKHSPRPHLPYTFTILVDERLYSTAAPGGYVYLTTGLLNFLKSESELAGILAHEIGEVQHQPGVFSSFRRHSEDLAALSAFIGSFFGPIGVASAAGVILLTSIPYGEVDKTSLLHEADHFAVNMMLESGYDPNALKQVLLRVYNSDTRETMREFAREWNEKRPITVDRIEKLDHLLTTVKFEKVMAQTEPERFTRIMKYIYEMYPSH